MSYRQVIDPVLLQVLEIPGSIEVRPEEFLSATATLPQ